MNWNREKGIGIILSFNPTSKGLIPMEIDYIKGLMKILGVSKGTWISTKPRASALKIIGSEWDWKGWELWSPEDGQAPPDVGLCLYWNSSIVHAFMGGKTGDWLGWTVGLVSWYSNRVPVLSKCTDSNTHLTSWDIIAKRWPAELAGSGTRFGTLLDNLKWKELLLRVRPNVENIWFISNGHRRIGDWVQGMKYKEEFPNGAWYLGDGLFFGMDERRPLAPAAGNASAVWIGFLKGGNLKRVKALAGALSLWTEGRKCHLVSPHWGEVNDPKAQEWEKALERQAGVVLEKRSIPGDSDAYFAWLNQWQGFIFIGKGDGRLSYINKTIWDCYMAGVPCLVWEEADPQKVIFGDSVCYWKQSEDLVEVFKRLDEPEERTRLVLEQKEKLEAWLKIDERREFIQWLETWEPKRPDTEMLKWLEQNLFNNKKNTNQLF